MSSSVAVNVNTAGKTPITKTLGIGMAAFAVIEAVITYFLVLGPLFINPVFKQCEDYNASGITSIVKLFGKTFASQEEIANNQIILTLWDAIFNVIMIYLVITGALLLLAFCFYKGFAFAKSYLIAVFGAKAVIALVPIMIPFALIRNSMKIFGAIDAVICIGMCIYCIYLNNLEYADDMLYTPEQMANMKKRGITAGIAFGMMLLFTVFSAFAMGAYGGNWSIYLGWLTDTGLGQGAVIAILLAVGMIASITYIREGDWAMYFYTAFGGAAAITNLIGIILRIVWIFRTYNPTKALANQGDQAAIEWVGANGMTIYWWINTIFLILAFIAAAALTFFAFGKIKGQITFKFTPDEKKPALATFIGAGSIVLSFVLTIVAITLWDKQQYGAINLGAMDYMYFIVYGGITLFLALSLLGGYSFTKLGTLGLYLIVASNNFSTIFTVFAARAAVVDSYAINGVSYVGYNYIISGVLYILSIIACLGIITVFVVKGVDDFLYQKRFK